MAKSLDFEEGSVKNLNAGLGDEIQAVLQYIFFHEALDQMGFDEFSKFFMGTAIAEMKHAERTMGQIWILRGIPLANPSNPTQPITDVRKMFELSKQLETKARMDYGRFAKQALADGDPPTHDLFESLVGDEQEHWDYVDIQIQTIDKFGDTYLAALLADK